MSKALLDRHQVGMIIQSRDRDPHQAGFISLGRDRGTALRTRTRGRSAGRSRTRSVPHPDRSTRILPPGKTPMTSPGHLTASGSARTSTDEESPGRRSRRTGYCRRDSRRSHRSFSLDTMSFHSVARVVDQRHPTRGGPRRRGTGQTWSLCHTADGEFTCVVQRSMCPVLAPETGPGPTSQARRGPRTPQSPHHRG